MIDVNFDYSKVKGSTPLHNKFKKEFMIKCAQAFYNIVVIPYDVGFVRSYSQPEICYRVGQEGVPDTIVLGKGWYLLLDMKTGKATLQKNQKAFQQRILEVNEGFHRVYKINSVAQGLQLIWDENAKASR